MNSSFESLLQVPNLSVFKFDIYDDVPINEELQCPPQLTYDFNSYIIR